MTTPDAPLQIGIIGHGAIASYVIANAPKAGATVRCAICRAGREDAAAAVFGPNVQVTSDLDSLPPDLAIVLDCAGHAGLLAHGPRILGTGTPVATVALGALADKALTEELDRAARRGRTRLHLASGAIGALDALRAAAVGALTRVTYRGIKPASGWRGSPAEDLLDLATLGDAEHEHFRGSAREAALRYPKNANVAAAVALAGIGFDDTECVLVADGNAIGNTHEIEAEGEFGNLRFAITGRSLPDNPRSSALAAMSMITQLRDRQAVIAF
ncbi:aspartate dehydrogenase [Algicella marina]|uniref:L-aspartate dehydrogenase n=1 Tax=Algicella marina TaxID=2683284 RepID=A0A6P1SY41_9RHOB|nr:aspartate dehydrogenase [Algicella marina]QHQ34273.1 aspartate dehydrogenase [Algicella marina]